MPRWLLVDVSLVSESDFSLAVFTWGLMLSEAGISAFYKSELAWIASREHVIDISLRDRLKQNMIFFCKNCSNLALLLALNFLYCTLLNLWTSLCTMEISFCDFNFTKIRDVDIFSELSVAWQNRCVCCGFYLTHSAIFRMLFIRTIKRYIIPISLFFFFSCFFLILRTYIRTVNPIVSDR